MGIHVVWDDDEKTIIRVDFLDRWRTENILTAIEQIEQMVGDSGTPRAHIILDATQTATIVAPKATENLRRLLELRKGHPRLGRLVIVGSGTISSSFLITILRLTRSTLGEDDYSIVATLDEARAFCREDTG